MKKEFVGEAIRPEKSSFDTARMAAGEPGLPREFTWRGKRYRVAAVRRSWRDTGPCRHKSGEMYVRRHWYEVTTDSAETMEIYFERQPRRGGNPQDRWRLYTVSP